MTLGQGLKLASTILDEITTSGLIDASGNLVKPTIAGALALVMKINATITAAGVTEPAEVQKIVSILAAVATLV